VHPAKIGPFFSPTERRVLSVLRSFERKVSECLDIHLKFNKTKRIFLAEIMARDLLEIRLVLNVAEVV
jgi:hypothetical protein